MSRPQTFGEWNFQHVKDMQCNIFQGVPTTAEIDKAFAVAATAKNDATGWAEGDEDVIAKLVADQMGVDVARVQNSNAYNDAYQQDGTEDMYMYI